VVLRSAHYSSKGLKRAAISCYDEFEPQALKACYM
jgi:hypothetical protein